MNSIKQKWKDLRENNSGHGIRVDTFAKIYEAGSLLLVAYIEYIFLLLIHSKELWKIAAPK